MQDGEMVEREPDTDTAAEDTVEDTTTEDTKDTVKDTTSEKTVEDATAEEAVKDTAGENAKDTKDAAKDTATEDTAEDTAGEDAKDTKDAAEDTAAEEAEDTVKKHWYVVHTYSGHENKVKTNMERAINSADLSEKFGQILVATEDFAEMKNGKRTITKKKTFPSYVLVEMEMGNEARHLVTNIPGVTGFVGTGRDPVPLRKEEVRRVLGLDAEGKVAKVAPSVPFKIGEHVRVIDGPFSDFTGVVDEINPERGKVKVMVSIFGRATPVELDFLQVQTV
jgi:transcriptional antiterminator NusG